MTRNPRGAFVAAAVFALGGLASCGRTGLLEGSLVDGANDGLAGASASGGAGPSGGSPAASTAGTAGVASTMAGAAAVRPSESECAPQVIYSIPDPNLPVLDVAVHGRFLYWSSSLWHCEQEIGKVMRGQVDGRAPAVELMSGMHCPAALAATADGLLVAENVGKDAEAQRAVVWSVDLSGGVRELRGDGRVASSMTADDSDIFWVEGDGGFEGKRTIFKMPRKGGVPKALVSSIDLGNSFRHGFALDATHLYWSDGRSSIMKMPKSGGKPAFVTATAAYPSQVFVTETGLFWIDEALYGPPGESFVKLLEWGSREPRVVVTNETRLFELWIDGATIYWATGDGPHNGSLWRTRLDESASPVQLWSGGPAPQAISGDATFVYWVGIVEHGLGAVWRVCR